jgi:hypothetical protein
MGRMAERNLMQAILPLFRRNQIIFVTSMQHDLLFRLADSGKMMVLVNLNPAVRKLVVDSFLDLTESSFAFMILHDSPDGLSFDIGRIATLCSDDFAWLAGSVGNYMRDDIGHISLIVVKESGAD